LADIVMHDLTSSTLVLCLQQPADKNITNVLSFLKQTTYVGLLKRVKD